MCLFNECFPRSRISLMCFFFNPKSPSSIDARARSTFVIRKQTGVSVADELFIVPSQFGEYEQCTGEIRHARTTNASPRPVVRRPPGRWWSMVSPCFAIKFPLIPGRRRYRSHTAAGVFVWTWNRRHRALVPGRKGTRANTRLSLGVRIKTRERRGISAGIRRARNVLFASRPYRRSAKQ